VATEAGDPVEEGVDVGHLDAEEYAAGGARRDISVGDQIQFGVAQREADGEDRTVVRVAERLLRAEKAGVEGEQSVEVGGDDDRPDGGGPRRACRFIERPLSLTPYRPGERGRVLRGAASTDSQQREGGSG
jgi:hypothetical protein